MTRTSIIIPTYKPGDYIKQCVASLAKQTFDKTSYEVLIVLNGCNEPYHSFLKGIVKEYPSTRFQIIQTDTPGVSNARNIGIERCTFENICFIDDDDWVSENYLENLNVKMATADSIVISNFKDYDETADCLKDGYLSKTFQHVSQRQQDISLMTAHRLFSSSCGKLIPKSVIGELRFDKRFTNGEDALFMANISKNVKNISLSTPDTIYYRRRRTGSASRGVMSRRSIISNAIRQYSQYIRIYLSDAKRYNLAFFINRLLAVTKRTILLIIRK